MNEITKIKVNGELESTYKLFSKNREFEKRAGGGGGGSDPIVENAKQTGGFGYTEQGEQTVITWDGDTEGIVDKGGHFYKVSELTPTIDEVIGGVINTKTGDGIFPTEITADSITAISEHLYTVQGYSRSSVIVALEDSEIEGITFEPGLYYSKRGSGVISVYIKSLTYGTPYTVHKIDKKYLPPHIIEEIIIKATEVERGKWEIDKTTLPTINLRIEDKDRIYFELEAYNSLGIKNLCKATSFDISGNNLRGAIGLCAMTISGDVTIYKTILSYSGDTRRYYAYVEEYALENITPTTT